MWHLFRKKPKQAYTYPEKDIAIEEVKQAVRLYSNQLPDNVPLSVVIKDDLSIDFNMLATVLKAKPKQAYYMSRETYEIFDEENYQLARDIDMVQKAVDAYMKQTNELPIIDGDPYKKVSYLKLEKRKLMEQRPNQNFYITDEEFLITYKKPN